MELIWPHAQGTSLIADSDLANLYPWPSQSHHQWVRANMVMSLDGCISGPEGLSRSISSTADRHLMGILRRDADVILVGAGTLRDENYGPTSRPLAIVTRSLKLPLSLRYFAESTADSLHGFALTTRSAMRQAPPELKERLDLIDCGDNPLNLRTGLDALNVLGHLRIHCEGGPELLAALVQQRLLNELLLTVSPLLIGGSTHLVNELLSFHAGGRITQVLTSDGTVFIRVLFEHATIPTH